VTSNFQRRVNELKKDAFLQDVNASGSNWEGGYADNKKSWSKKRIVPGGDAVVSLRERGNKTSWPGKAALG